MSIYFEQSPLSWLDRDLWVLILRYLKTHEVIWFCELVSKTVRDNCRQKKGNDEKELKTESREIINWDSLIFIHFVDRIKLYTKRDYYRYLELAKGVGYQFCNISLEKCYLVMSNSLSNNITGDISRILKGTKSLYLVDSPCFGRLINKMTSPIAQKATKPEILELFFDIITIHNVPSNIGIVLYTIYSVYFTMDHSNNTEWITTIKKTETSENHDLIYSLNREGCVDGFLEKFYPNCLETLLKVYKYYLTNALMKEYPYFCSKCQSLMDPHPNDLIDNNIPEKFCEVCHLLIVTYIACRIGIIGSTDRSFTKQLLKKILLDKGYITFRDRIITIQEIKVMPYF